MFFNFAVFRKEFSKPFEYYALSFLLNALELKEKIEFKAISTKVQNFLRPLKGILRKPNILSAGTEMLGFDLKDDLLAMKRRIQNNVFALQALSSDDETSQDYKNLLFLSIYKEDPNLYRLYCDATTEIR